MTRKEKIQLLNQLVRAKNLIRKRSRWTQNDNARRVDNAPCASEAPEATKWCATGAIVRITGSRISHAILCIKKMEIYAPRQALTEFNDTHSFREVHGLFRRAIEGLRAEIRKDKK